MTGTPSRTPSRRSSTEPNPHGGKLVELGEEQAQVSMLYGWLDRSRARARDQLARAQATDGGATPQAKVDKDAMVSLHARRLVQLSTVENGLCLGRLDHRDGSRLYIGRLGLSDDEQRPLLIDWRAPAAEPFYRATPTARGEVVRRRHLQTRGRQVVGFHDDVLDLEAMGEGERASLDGDAALLAALRGPRTGRMADIVATIQAEQDQVIRSELPGILVVQGGPGTGKTAVALHRAAYLLYTHRHRLARRGVLVVGPNPTFLRYIEQVLPSLGETDVLLSTVEQLFPGVTPAKLDPVGMATLKGDLRMVEVLAAAVRDRERVPAGPVEFRAGDFRLRLDPEVCARARDLARETGAPHNEARATFVRVVLTALQEQVARIARAEADRMEADQRAVDELIDDSVFGDDEQLDDGPLLGDEEVDDLRAELWAGFAPAVHEAIERLWPRLTAQRLLTDLLTSPERLGVAAAGLTPTESASLLRRPAPAARPDAADGPGGWSPADVPLLDEAAELLGEDERAERRAAARLAAAEQRDRAYARGVLDILGVGVVDPELLAEQVAGRYRERDALAPLAERARGDRTWNFGHVIVDEAQELSPMAWRMLMRRCRSRSMTVVGDLAQTGSPGGATSWLEALGPHAPGRWREGRLTVNYRTPAEVMAVATDLLASVAPELTPPTSVREGGEPPWRQQVDEADLGKVLPGLVAAEVAAVDPGRVAVIAPAARAADLGRAVAAGVEGVAVADGPDALDATVAILTVTEAKGLEFDAVVVVDPAGILAESPNGANNLYVALTRTTRRLGVVHGGDLPAALSRLEPRAPGAPLRPARR